MPDYNYQAETNFYATELSKRDKEIAMLREEIARLIERMDEDSLIDDTAEKVAATAYQIFGVMRAPVRVLDYFSAIARGKRPKNILPFSPDEIADSPEGKRENDI